IEGLDAPMPEGIVFHAGTRKESGGWRTAGGRVLGVTAVAPSLEEARRNAYGAVSRIRFQGMQYRKDIGAALVETAAG
ncbi:MAG: phosphoribosylamine--glycine ligase, partial [Elusimicrobia bacterium]|nr:phosphoribosylamine--glycine ligase [Elusimicrobiota bacterium]